jgi:6-phosphofructo-2-kinase/fructose-2,6-biphosphatase 2
LQRTISTARHLCDANPNYTKLEWKALDELDAGVCDGLTYKQIQEQYPADFTARDEDKYNYRYRGGESYRDVVIRLEPIIMELERSENVLIVTHQAVVRCIYAYFMNLPQEQSPWMEVPLHTLIKLTPRAYSTHEERFKANIPAVSTFRSKGSKAEHQTAEHLLRSTISSGVSSNVDAATGAIATGEVAVTGKAAVDEISKTYGHSEASGDTKTTGGSEAKQDSTSEGTATATGDAVAK